MKIKKAYLIPLCALNFQPVIIAQFGPARLVKHFAGHYELLGGTAEHQAIAREWCSFFAPEIVFKPASPKPRSDFAFAA